MTQTRTHAPLTTRRLTVRAETADEQTRSVEAVLATEEAVPVYDADRYCMVDEVLRMDGCRCPEQLPLLDSHNRDSVTDQLGSWRELRVVDGRLVGRMHFARDDDSYAAWQKVRDGHIRDVSVGYRVLEFSDLRAGETREVAGRSYTAGKRALRVTTAWQVKEGSLTPIGADEAAKIRAAADVARGGSADDKPSTQEPQHMGELESAAADTARDDDATEGRTDGMTVNRGEAVIDREQILRDERERVIAIRKLATPGTPAEVVERAISEGVSADRAARMILEAERASSAPAAKADAPMGFVRGSFDNGREHQLRALSAGIGHQIGLGDHALKRRDMTSAERAQRERALEDGYRYRDMRFMDVLRESIQIVTGRQAPYGANAVFNEWMRLARDSRSQGYFERATATVMDLANIFTDNVNAQMIRAFDEQDTPLEQIARAVDVPDFRSNERPRATQFGDLKSLPSGGIAQHIAVADIGESYKAKRYAAQFVFDEQDAINDRFDLFADLPRRAGVAARRVPSDLLAYILLYGGTAGLTAGALFSSGNSNTATNALSSANLTTGIAAMLKQTEAAEDGRSVPLNVSAKYIITGPTLKHTAMELVNSSLIVVAGSTDTVRGNANTLMNAVTPICDNRLEAGVTDPATEAAASGSTTTWFLAADPALYPVLELGYVRSTGRSPRLRSEVLKYGQFGIGYDVSFDVGAKALAYQGLYRGNT